jgi:methylenetetrahydrofolate dehydrogenase (NADP+)/methenyltetrahydrofolate cyclohydrolase
LAVVLVGDDQASFSFVQQKKKRAEELGVDFREYHFPATSTTDFLREQVGRIARQRPCGGVIVQLPLPAHINRHSVCNGIPQNKDVDVLSERTLGSFYTGRNPVLPPAVATFDSFISAAGIDLSKKQLPLWELDFWLENQSASSFKGGHLKFWFLMLDLTRHFFNKQM